MEYLVMECHESYAVVLDSRGRFLKVANLRYEVGQELDAVVELREPVREKVIPWKGLTALAACTSFLPDTKLSHIQIYIIIDHDQIFRFQFVIIQHFPDAFAA